MNSLTYYHVTGRPPTARTDATDRNMIFFLEHQLRWDRLHIEQFMQEIPPNTNEPQQPWGSQMMNLGQLDQQGNDDGPPDQPDVDEIPPNHPDDFAGGGDDDFAPPAVPHLPPPPPPPSPPSDEDDESDDEEDDGVPRRAPRQYRGEPRGPVRRSQRVNQRASKKRAIEKMRTKRSGLLYKFLFGR